MRFSKARSVSLCFLILFAGVACEREGDAPGQDVTYDPPIERDLPVLLEDGRLTALITWDSTSYFIYRGTPMGYEYELLQAYARDQGVDLDLKLIRDRTDMWQLLNRGEGDIAAGRIFEVKADSEHVAFTESLYETAPMVVQNSGETPELTEAVEEALDEFEPTELSVKSIDRPSQLAGEEVATPKGSSLSKVVIELSDRLTGDIHLVEVEDVVSSEPLIRRVSEGKLQLTVAPENVADLSEEYYTNIVVEPAIGPELEVVWALRSNATELKDSLDAWLTSAEARELSRELYRKYFEDREGFRERVEDEYLTTETGRLSEFDDILRERAADIGWDWRLLAAQAYQESRFDARARSWAGAQGLLQLMPRTAREVGVRDSYDPAQNARGAVRYLRMMEEAWEDEITDPDERLKFILASYNAGRGHVLDAQRLAEKYGDDPEKWDDVAYWMLQKSKRKYYTDPVVRHGFVRGMEPVEYVSRILDRFEHYKEFVE